MCCRAFQLVQFHVFVTGQDLLIFSISQSLLSDKFIVRQDWCVPSGLRLLSTLKKRGISFLLCILSVYSSRSFTWVSKFARKKHNQTYSTVCDNLLLGHLIIISVNAFYYAVCVLMSMTFIHFTNYLFVEWICTRSSVILVLIMIYSVH